MLLREVKTKLQKVFELRDMGSLHHCLGIQFSHVGGEITLSQENYIENLINKFNMAECKPVSTPMETGLKLEKGNGLTEMENIPYQMLIGSLMYLAVATRPEIMFAVSYLSQYNTCFDNTHWHAAKRVIRYLKGTKNVTIRYKQSGMALTGMADADWAACTVDRRSYTGYIFKYGGGLISYASKKQRTVALSTAEAEYMAMTEATKEALHLKYLLEDIGVFQQTVTIYNDNLAAQMLVNNQMTGKRSKHISIKEHFIRDCVQKKLVTIRYKDTEHMEADLFTKAIPQPRLLKLLKMIGVTQT
ncbi:copia protein isoform X2 [Leptidea sinapis]|uniref:copia protein isoform X2 n=1 Tax=Leptidea sinapis TaxID=189913 RepID=UPI0021C3CBF5|nr:copia protein isoform X2 [Leptidea sinapis]